MILFEWISRLAHEDIFPANSCLGNETIWRIISHTRIRKLRSDIKSTWSREVARQLWAQIQVEPFHNPRIIPCSSKTIQSTKIRHTLLFITTVTLTTLRSVLDYIIRAYLWQSRALASINPIRKRQGICPSSCLLLTALILSQFFRFPFWKVPQRAFGILTGTCIL